MSIEKSYLHDLLSEEYLLKRRNLNFSNLMDHFRLIATNRFKWSNLPENIESSYIENFLYDHGQVAFYDDDLLGYIVVPCNNGADLNIYGEPITLNLKATNYSKIVPVDEVVRIKSNDISKPLITYVNYYVYLINEIEKISYQNLRQQRFPYIIAANKNTELTLRKIFEQLEEGKEAIVVDEKLNMSTDSSIKVLQTNAPYLLDKLRSEKNEVRAELYTILGINNSINNKKERLIVDEVNVNNGQILMNLELEYKHRLLAAEKINAKYNLNIKVEKVIDKLSYDFLGSEQNNIKILEGDNNVTT